MRVLAIGAMALALMLYFAPFLTASTRVMPTRPILAAP